jgi:hypothetical protein
VVSKYSIHDLSRSTGEGGENLARFNMPLELGMAAAFRFERHGSDRPHRWLALVHGGYAYRRFLSDLAGGGPARSAVEVNIVRDLWSWDNDPTTSCTIEDRVDRGENVGLASVVLSYKDIQFTAPAELEALDAAKIAHGGALEEHFGRSFLRQLKYLL